MSTKQKITVKQQSGDWVAVSIGFRFKQDDPRAGRIYKAVAMCVKEALTEDEAAEFLERMNLERLSQKGRRTK